MGKRESAFIFIIVTVAIQAMLWSSDQKLWVRPLAVVIVMALWLVAPRQPVASFIKRHPLWSIPAIVALHVLIWITIPALRVAVVVAPALVIFGALVSVMKRRLPLG